MSLLNKKIEEITFDDIEDLVNIEKPQENEFIDYKRELPRDKIHKDISAFANTYGGWIIVGVEEDDDSRPEEIVGVDEKDLGNVINSICMDRISPPVFCQTRYIENEKNDKRIFLIRIDESDLAPHAVDNNTTVYIKIKDQKRPYKKADLDQIDWLKNRRSRYVKLRKSIQNRSRQRFQRILQKKFMEYPFYEFIICPKFPHRNLIEYYKLLNFLGSFRYRFTPTSKELELVLLDIHSAADSIIFSQVNEQLYKNYCEISSFGQYSNFAIFCDSENDKDDDFKFRGYANNLQGEWINLRMVLALLFRDIVIGLEILDKVDFFGNVNIIFNLHGIKGKRLHIDISSMKQYFDMGVKSEIENRFEFEQDYPINEIRNNRLNVFGELVDRLIFEFDSGVFYEKGAGEVLANHFQQSFCN